MLLTVIETPSFIDWSQSVWSPQERDDFVTWIADNSEAGDVILSAGGLRKVRWARSGMGKQGGARVIYYTRNTQGQVVLLLVYAKAQFDNLSVEFLRRLKDKYDEN
jgi:hypothetical protein